MSTSATAPSSTKNNNTQRPLSSNMATPNHATNNDPFSHSFSSSGRFSSSFNNNNNNRITTPKSATATLARDFTHQESMFDQRGYSPNSDNQQAIETEDTNKAQKLAQQRAIQIQKQVHNQEKQRKEEESRKQQKLIDLERKRRAQLQNLQQNKNLEIFLQTYVEPELFEDAGAGDQNDENMGEGASEAKRKEIEDSIRKAKKRASQALKKEEEKKKLEEEEKKRKENEKWEKRDQKLMEFKKKITKQQQLEQDVPKTPKSPKTPINKRPVSANAGSAQRETITLREDSAHKRSIPRPSVTFANTEESIKKTTTTNLRNSVQKPQIQEQQSRTKSAMKSQENQPKPPTIKKPSIKDSAIKAKKFSAEELEREEQQLFDLNSENFISEPVKNLEFFNDQSSNSILNVPTPMDDEFSVTELDSINNNEEKKPKRIPLHIPKHFTNKYEKKSVSKFGWAEGSSNEGNGKKEETTNRFGWKMNGK